MDEEQQMDTVDTNQPQNDSSIMINKSWKHPTAAKQEIIQRDAAGNNSTWLAWAPAWNSLLSAVKLVVMKTGSDAHFSNYQNCNKSSNNKIPEFAKEYKREYQFIRGLNKDFRYLANFIENIEDEYEQENFKDYKLE